MIASIWMYPSPPLRGFAEAGNLRIAAFRSVTGPLMVAVVATNPPTPLSSRV